MESLAALLEDNAALHEMYPLIAAGEDWRGALQKAADGVRALQARTAHPCARASSRRLLTALADARIAPDDGSPAALARQLNECEAAMGRPTTSLEGRETLLVRQQVLRVRLQAVAAGGHGGIPRVIHLIKTDAGDEDLPLTQYLCYRSVLAHCREYRVVLHAPAVPHGPRWKTLLAHMEIDLAMPPQWLGSRQLVTAAHQSDIWRLRLLIRHGGFYFDWDMLLLRPPDDLRHHVCVMALEGREEGYDEVLGVSAIGARPGSPFLASWLDAMPSAFNPAKYVAHSTVLARRLALERLALVRIVGYRTFYYPGWGERAMRWLFDPAQCLFEDELREHLAASIGIHLFCSHAHFLRWARDLCERDIEKPRCNLATLMRPYL